jgi:hypothetical protein
MIEHPIHQTRHRSYTRRVAPAEMPIRLRQRLETPQPADAMLNPDTPTRQRPVVTAIRQRPLLPTRLAAWRRAQAVGMQLRYPHVGQIADSPDPFGQPRQQLRTPQQLDVRRRSRCAGSHVYDPAVLLVHGHLALERMPLLLAAVKAFLPPPRPLHRLLKGIDKDCHVGRVPKQRRETFASPAAGVGYTHAILAGRFQKGQATVDGPLGGGIGDAEEVAEHFLGGVVTQPEDGEQELVLDVEIEGIAAAEGALAVGSLQALASAVGEGVAEGGEELVEDGKGDAGEIAEDSGEGTQPLKPQQHGGLRNAVSLNNHAADIGKSPAIVKKVYYVFEEREAD